MATYDDSDVWFGFVDFILALSGMVFEVTWCIKCRKLYNRITGRHLHNDSNVCEDKILDL